MKKVSIITVNFRQTSVTVDFLRSVAINTVASEVEVILVDNGALEDQYEFFKSIYPEINYIYSPENLGFSGGNNLGINTANGKYLLFLNNDTEICTNLVDTLVQQFEDNPEIGLLSPLILYYHQPDIIQYAGFTEMNYLTCRNHGIGNMEVDSGQYNNDSRETGYIHGAAMMCRRDDLKDAGLMPTEFFLYYEEIDWCEKFKKAGKKIWFTGKTKVYHKESISVGKESILKTYFMTRNRWLFIRRNTSFLTTLGFSIYYIFIALPKQIVVALLKGRPELVKYALKGLFWNFTNSKESHKLGIKLKD